MVDIKIKQCTEYPINKNNIYIILEVSNDSEQDFYVSRDALMLDGFRSDKFEIIKEKTMSKLRYIEKNVKYIPDDFTLKAHSKILSPELNLSAAYNFGEVELGDLYRISFKSYTEYCLDIDHTDCVPVTLNGELILKMEDIEYG